MLPARRAVVAGALLSAVAQSLSGCTTHSSAEEAAPGAAAATTVLIHPPFAEDYVCSEHYAGQLSTLGDALGQDCFVTRLVPTADGGHFSRPFLADGTRNEDWFGYGQAVFAPINGVVERIVRNEVENIPGHPGNPPATYVVLRGIGGLRVTVAHLSDIRVAEGERVDAGQPFARVANNGFSRSPHVHIGAWRSGTALPVSHDLTAKGRTRTQPAVGP